MDTNHTPPTQAELDAWKIRARDSAPGTSEVFFCLIAEVERLRADRDEIKSGWSKANDDLARLTKEVEELRSIIQYGQSIGLLKLPSTTDSAMQQKGEE